MTTDTKIKQQIYQLIELLPAEQLPRLLNFVNALLKPTPPPKETNVAPIYKIHEHAADTGIPNLAAEHDHYLYGVSKKDA